MFVTHFSLLKVMDFNAIDGWVLVRNPITRVRERTSFFFCYQIYVLLIFFFFSIKNFKQVSGQVPASILSEDIPESSV